MSKYIIAFLFPWLSFFLRGKIFNGLICIISSGLIIAAVFLMRENITKYGAIVSVFRFIGFAPSAWALYSVRQSKETEGSEKISELS